MGPLKLSFRNVCCNHVICYWYAYKINGWLWEWNHGEDDLFKQIFKNCWWNSLAKNGKRRNIPWVLQFSMARPLIGSIIWNLRYHQTLGFYSILWWRWQIFLCQFFVHICPSAPKINNFGKWFYCFIAIDSKTKRYGYWRSYWKRNWDIH